MSTTRRTIPLNNVETKMGTTGSSAEIAMNVELPNILARVRQHATVPLAVGFGVATRQHFETVARAGADGVVIGSRIVSLIKAAQPDKVADAVRDYCADITRTNRDDKHLSQPQNGHVAGQIVQPITSGAQDEPGIGNNPSELVVLPARFGEFGGQYVPEALVDCLVELEAAHRAAMTDPEFWAEFKSLYGYMNRPSTLYYSDRLTEHAGGAKIWFKREDLYVTCSILRKFLT